MMDIAELAAVLWGQLRLWGSQWQVALGALDSVVMGALGFGIAFIAVMENSKGERGESKPSRKIL